MAELRVNYLTSERRLETAVNPKFVAFIGSFANVDVSVNPENIVPGSVVIGEITDHDAQLIDRLAAIAQEKNLQGETVVPILLLREKRSALAVDSPLRGASSFRTDGVSYDPNNPRSLSIAEVGIRAFLVAAGSQANALALQPDAVLDDDSKWSASDEPLF